MPMKISGVKVVKHEGPRALVKFIEKGTDDVLFEISKALVDGTVEVINCQIQNVNGKAMVTIPLIGEVTTASHG
jgi:hypothetical protein